jgi:hypothetical protein
MLVSSALEEIIMGLAPEAVLEQTFYFNEPVPPNPPRPKWLSVPAW